MLWINNEQQAGSVETMWLKEVLESIIFWRNRQYMWARNFSFFVWGVRQRIYSSRNQRGHSSSHQVPLSTRLRWDFKWGLEWLQDLILLLFNQLCKNEIYLSQWNEWILPVFQSGSFNDPNNYRGIAIMSCLGKLCSVVINLRLYAWAEKHGKYQNGK